MRASPLLPIILTWAVTFTVFCSESDARWLCAPCMSSEECDREPPEPCIWGPERDSCERKVCAKGPGERCGGPQNILGKCGAGMMCNSDERCHGCSTETFQCYP